MIAEVLGRPDAEIQYAERHPGDVVRLLSDSSKASNVFGFKTTVGLLDGLGYLRDWYKHQGKSPEELLEEEVLLNWESRDAARPRLGRRAGLLEYALHSIAHPPPLAKSL